METNYELPNLHVINLCHVLLLDLYEKKIFPNRIGLSCEEGICLTFLHDNKSLYVELYNNRKIGYIINNDKKKKIIEIMDINDYEKLIEVICKFMEGEDET